MGARRACTIILAVGLVLVLAALLPWQVSHGLVQGLTVDCDAGQRLQTAIDQARPGNTLTVSGFCAENVAIGEEAARITLDGQGTATIHAPLPGGPPRSESWGGA